MNQCAAKFVRVTVVPPVHCYVPEPSAAFSGGHCGRPHLFSVNLDMSIGFSESGRQICWCIKRSSAAKEKSHTPAHSGRADAKKMTNSLVLRACSKCNSHSLLQRDTIVSSRWTAGWTMLHKKVKVSSDIRKFWIHWAQWPPTTQLLSWMTIQRMYGTRFPKVHWSVWLAICLIKKVALSENSLPSVVAFWLCARLPLHTAVLLPKFWGAFSVGLPSTMLVQNLICIVM